MKKQKFTLIFSALFIVILCLPMFTACQRNEQIDASQVEKIVIWTNTSTEKHELNADDSARLIELYNSSEYEGEGTGEGGTPEFGIIIDFRDGTYLHMNDFGVLDKDFEISLYDSDGNEKEWYYINSEELYTFVSELADNVFESRN